MLSPKTSPRLWVLLLPPEPKELALMSDSEGWWLERAESRVWGLKGDRRQGSPHQAEERSVHLHPASGMDRPRSERNSGGCRQKQLDFSGVQGFSLFGSLCFIPLYILLYLLLPLFQVFKLLCQR